MTQRPGRLSGRHALVTGAGSGIGRAICLKFVSEGASVAALDVDAASVEQTAAMAREVGGRATHHQADIRDKASIKKLVAEVIGAFGRLDALVNNAGIFGSPAPLLDMTDETWERVLGVNLQGAYNVTRVVLPEILKAGGGSIVNVASVASYVVGGGGAAYTTSKHAVLGFTRQLAHDYARAGIRVNAVCPGAINTGMTEPIWREHPEALEQYSNVPAGRIGEPSDVANLVAFLSSDEASFIHGTGVVIDGGLMLT